MAALSALGVPSGAREVIQRRLARLEPATARLLTYGAVCGPEFRLDVVASMHGIAEADAVAALGKALAAGIVVEPAVDRFAFRHALIREALYAQIESRTERARLHLAAGEALERLEAPAAELARHFHAAMAVGGAGKALGYGVEAGKQAAGALAYEEAIGHCRNALEALDALGLEHEGFRLLTGLGRLQWQVGDGAAARATFRRAADLAAAHRRRRAARPRRARVRGPLVRRRAPRPGADRAARAGARAAPARGLGLARAAARRARLGAAVQPHAGARAGAERRGRRDGDADR